MFDCNVLESFCWILPDRLFELRSNPAVYGICQNSVGIGPFSRFSDKSSCDKLMSLPRPGGMPGETIYVKAKVN